MLLPFLFNFLAVVGIVLAVVVLMVAFPGMGWEGVITYGR